MRAKRRVLKLALLALLLTGTASAQTWFMAHERVEFSLERAPSSRTLLYLLSRYNKVEFARHPTANGFYARGSQEDLARIWSEIAKRERLAKVGPEPFRLFVPIPPGTASANKLEMERLFPDVLLEVIAEQTFISKELGVQDLLLVAGNPEDVDLVEETLSAQSPRIDQAMVDLKLTKLTSEGLQSLEIQPTTTLLKSTVVIRENGRVIHTYSEPARARFTSAAGAEK